LGRTKNYDDHLIKRRAIRFFAKSFGVALEINPTPKKIDLLIVGKPHIGVEVERGGWSGDFWVNDYSLRSKQQFRTVNMPRRKAEYFLNPNTENIFVRSNHDFTQFIVVRADTVREKFIPTYFFGGAGYGEHWFSFKREDVETYNYSKGKYIKEKN
jgi:hypothetical protein